MWVHVENNLFLHKNLWTCEAFQLKQMIYFSIQERQTLIPTPQPPPPSLSGGLVRSFIHIIHLWGRFSFVPWLLFAPRLVWISCFNPAVMFSSHSQSQDKMRVHKALDSVFRCLSCSEPGLGNVNHMPKSHCSSFASINILSAGMCAS